ncbi:hypothetical protein GCM10017044_23730 [Kordiimonas sediminis]|uniref:DUF4399 domain-containing protein n=2 Tax=Kordiimonas sediminis TaxID=1735581 RepID=A0A919E9P0_9PROT|nr:hypothetical protein GCM10017044_23730 [Kordiimonas sediminis]
MTSATISADDKASVYFIGIKDGDTVPSTFTVRFGLNGMGVAPAGVEQDNTGHHHLLINTEMPDLSEPIPMDDNHRHFGGGQTEVTITLPEGKHTLQLLLGNAFHTPHAQPVYSDRITITVKD